MFVRLSMLRILAMMAIFYSGLWAQAQPGCITGKCHNDMGTKKFVHGPVGAGVCNVCHVLVEGKEHEFRFFADRQELCLGCHETSRDMMLMAVQHQPLAEGKCTACHDPHQSDFRYALKGNAADLCYQCHDQAGFNREVVHGPVGVGDCNVCHNPHASENERLLVQPEDQICFLCHGEKLEMMQKRHIHSPVQQKCTSCHNPHSNVAKNLLGSAVPDLCFDCHEPFAGVSVEHPPVARGDCKECHDAHATDYPAILNSDMADLCFSCHDDVGQYTTSKVNKHGPVRDGDCTACHNPHGSENYRLLKKYFPKEFYLPYATENYAICFECHNRNIALDSTTTTLTDFRNGNRNLHYLHVNKEVKGRSCKACHHEHATNQAKHIRLSVPYGSADWELPVNYTKLDDGGKCVVGCHAPKEYHR